MDELSDFEARPDANAENLRRAFGAPVGGEPPAFAALLERLATGGATGGAPGGPTRAAGRGGGLPERAADHAHGAVLAGAAMRATWFRPFADT